MAERTNNIWNDDDGEKDQKPREKHRFLKGFLLFFLTLVVVLGVVLVAAWRDGTGFDALRRYFSYGKAESASGTAACGRPTATPSTGSANRCGCTVITSQMYFRSTTRCSAVIRKPL